jgi:hypothetical protein
VLWHAAPHPGRTLIDLRARVASIGGTIDQEIPENADSAFNQKFRAVILTF